MVGSEFPVNSNQIWVQALNIPAASTLKGAIFLDRDGVILEERHYLSDPRGVSCIPGASKFLTEAEKQGLARVIVTNQSGIERGYFGWKQFAAVNTEMLRQLNQAGANVDLIIACPFSPHELEAMSIKAKYRKPGPGMILKALEILVSVDPASCVIVGDRDTDLIAGKRARLKGGWLVKTGHGESSTHALPQIQDKSFKAKSFPSIADINIKSELADFGVYLDQP